MDVSHIKVCNPILEFSLSTFDTIFFANLRLMLSGTFVKYLLAQTLCLPCLTAAWYMNHLFNPH